MRTKFIKVSTADRLPEKDGKYTVQRNDSENYHEMYYFNGSPLNVSFWTAYVEYWLEEKPDYEDEMKETLEKIISIAALGEKVPDYMVHEGENLLTKLKTES